MYKLVKVSLKNIVDRVQGSIAKCSWAYPSRGFVISVFFPKAVVLNPFKNVIPLRIWKLKNSTTV